MLGEHRPGHPTYHQHLSNTLHQHHGPTLSHPSPVLVQEPQIHPPPYPHELYVSNVCSSPRVNKLLWISWRLTLLCPHVNKLHLISWHLPMSCSRSHVNKLLLISWRLPMSCSSSHVNKLLLISWRLPMSCSRPRPHVNKLLLISWRLRCPTPTTWAPDFTSQTLTISAVWVLALL
jgi:hypothetical protein